jgi:signal transduction histidine kinase
MTLREIGLTLGISESRVSQVHSRAVLRLRTASAARSRPEVDMSTAEPMKDPLPIPTGFDDLPRPSQTRELIAVAALVRARCGGRGRAAELAERIEEAARAPGRGARRAQAPLLASLSVNHDINNALVGVVGNAQLLSLGPAASLPGVKERLEVIAREANRIKLATLRLSELKQALLVEGRAQGGDAS